MQEPAEGHGDRSRRISFTLSADFAKLLEDMAAVRDETVAATLRRAILLQRYLDDSERDGKRVLLSDEHGGVVELWLDGAHRNSTVENESASPSAELNAELGLLGPDGRPVDAREDATSQLATQVRWVSDELKRLVAADPALLFEVGWQKFEHIVAELLSSQGFDVNLVPAGRDTGVDIFAATSTGVGSFLYLVQCKNYGPTNPVGLPVVERLHGRVVSERATAGLVVTTSRFTRRALEFERRNHFQMSLTDFAGLCNWLEVWRPDTDHNL